jgi:hypothetical protein
MPRLTHLIYVRRHQYVRDVWLKEQKWFLLVPTRDQRPLFEFYCPHRDLTDNELREHRRAVTAAHPSLPQQASKILIRWLDEVDRCFDLAEQAAAMPPVSAPTKYIRSKDKQLEVGVVIKPEPDWARIVIAAVEEMLQQQWGSEETPKSAA